MKADKRPINYPCEECQARPGERCVFLGKHRRPCHDCRYRRADETRARADAKRRERAETPLLSYYEKQLKRQGRTPF